MKLTIKTFWTASSAFVHLYDNRDAIGVDHGNLLYIGRNMENVDAVIDQLPLKNRLMS